MSAGTNKNVAYIATLAVVIPVVVALWFAAPFFLPMYTWLTVDLKKISAASGIPEATLATKLTMRVRYNPRGGSELDPTPWQIIDASPTWDRLFPEADSETQVLVRCNFISGNDGKPPNTTYINSTWRDRYYKCIAVRLPAGSLGFTNKRPVVVYNQMDLVRMTVTDADTAKNTVANWDNDDEWPERADGFTSP